MTICSMCNIPIPEIGHHSCYPRPGSYSVPVPFIPRRETGQKCDICGSTAIDHTENQCTLNRKLKLNKGKLK